MSSSPSADPNLNIPVVSNFLRDFRAAVSYLSFYSSDSPFVAQATRHFHQGLVSLLKSVSPLVFESKEGDLHVNGMPFPGEETILHALTDRDCCRFSVSSGVTDPECQAFLRNLAAPGGDGSSFHEALKPGGFFKHIHLESGQEVEAPVAATAAPTTQETVLPPPSPAVSRDDASIPTPSKIAASEERMVLTADDIQTAERLVSDPRGLFSLVAEAWQMSRSIGRFMADNPEARAFQKVFHRFFEHLLDRVGTVSPELEAVQSWFQCPDGERVEDRLEDSMRALLATAIERGWTAVLFDPATSGLVSESLAHWGADGRHDLVEHTVEALARGLQGDAELRQLALTHLMDSRPWVSNTRLLHVILDRLTAQLSEETDPALYQKGLLIAWDLVEPALKTRDENLATSVLGLLATLHLHADDEEPVFPERPSLVRHWILGKSAPDLVRRLVDLAQANGKLGHFPLLSMLAAPILLRDFYAAGPEEIPKYLRAFAEMKEQVQSVLVERLPDSAEEAEVELMLLILRTCGIDPALALQLSAWVAKGSKELKFNIIETIVDLKDPRGGPALRLALLDDSEDVAVAAVKALGAIGFTPAAQLMVRAVRMRRDHKKPHEKFHEAVCECLGVFGREDAVPYLMEQARHKGFPMIGGASPAVRASAIRALAKFDNLEILPLFEEMIKEKDPSIQVALEEALTVRQNRV